MKRKKRIHRLLKNLFATEHSIKTSKKTKRFLFSCSALFVASGLGSASHAQHLAADSLRVCASTQQAPYSMQDGTGFENRLAQVLANEMNRNLEFVWTERPAIYLVRDYLNKGKCDLVMGVDTGDERMLTSEPYYRTGYVFISKEDQHFEGNSWTDPSIENYSRFAMSFGSPAEVMLRQIGMSKYEDNAAYLYSLVNFKSRRNQYTQIPPARLVSEVAQGNADLAVAFAPEVARYVEASPIPLKMSIISNDQHRADGKEVPHHFSQSVGVRKEDQDLLSDVNRALQNIEPKITDILEKEGIPLLEIAG